MRILFLSKRFYTHRDLRKDRFGRLYHLPRELAARGHSVANWVLDFRTRESLQVTEDGVAYHHRPTPLNAIPLVFSPPIREVTPWRPEIIVASGHIHLGWIGYRIARSLQIPFIFDIYDYYPAFHPLIQRLTKPIFQNLCRRANGITVVSEALRAKIAPWQPNLCVLENGYNPTIFRPIPEERAKLRGQFGIGEDESAIAFTGTISKELGIDILLQACEQIRRKGTPVRLLLAGALGRGFSPQDPRYNYLGCLPQSRVAELLNAVDLGVIPSRPTKRVHYSNSCKLVEYLACQLPVVATRTGDHQRILGAQHPGLIPPEDPNSLAQAIQQQLQNRVISPIPTQSTWESLAHTIDQFLVSQNQQSGA